MIDSLWHYPCSERQWNSPSLSAPELTTNLYFIFDCTVYSIYTIAAIQSINVAICCVQTHVCLSWLGGWERGEKLTVYKTEQSVRTPPGEITQS